MEKEKIKSEQKQIDNKSLEKKKKKNTFPIFTEEEGRLIWKQGICKRKFSPDW